LFLTYIEIGEQTKIWQSSNNKHASSKEYDSSTLEEARGLHSLQSFQALQSFMANTQRNCCQDKSKFGIQCNDLKKPVIGKICRLPALSSDLQTI
jgi:hypothetical protein